jgi:hypothetical protein
MRSPSLAEILAQPAILRLRIQSLDRVGLEKLMHVKVDECINMLEHKYCCAIELGREPLDLFQVV